MRCLLIGLTLLLFGCTGDPNPFGNPFVGFGGFVSDTLSINRGPNQPPGNSVNQLRIEGKDAPSEALLPEPGDVWPGPPPPEPTLEDIQKMQGTDAPEALPLPMQLPGPAPNGSSTPPGSVQSPTMAPPSMAPQSSAAPPRAPAVAKPVQPTTIGVVQTPSGPATITASPNGEQNFMLPNGTTGRAIPSANGTLTLISPDGSVQSVPAPR
jgi:hypothetical protein